MLCRSMTASTVLYGRPCVQHRAVRAAHAARATLNSTTVQPDSIMPAIADLQCADQLGIQCLWGKSGQLDSLKICGPGSSYTFSMSHLPTGSDTAALIPALTAALRNRAIEVVMYDAARWSEYLRYQHGIDVTSTPIFDTWVAHAVALHFAAKLGGQLRAAKQAKTQSADILAAYGLSADVLQPDQGWSGVPARALCRLAAAQKAHLGRAGTYLASTLSAAAAQRFWRPADCKHEMWDIRHSDPVRELVIDRTNQSFYLAACEASVTGPTSEAGQSSPVSPLIDPDVLHLLPILPDNVRQGLQALCEPSAGAAESLHPILVEIIADYGRPVRARFADGLQATLSGAIDIGAAVQVLQTAKLQGQETAPAAGQLKSFVTLPWQKRQELLQRQTSGSPFNNKNRMGIDGTLHRISAIMGEEQVLGLTYRCGRHVAGMADILHDVLLSIWKQPSRDAAASMFASGLLPLQSSILIIGPPATGKTTFLRDLAAFASDFERGNKQVRVIDSSNEIAGDGHQAHPCIGQARRMKVPADQMQGEIAREALKNHSAEIILLDELGNNQDATAMREIADSGVSLIATAHAPDFESLMDNPDLKSLLGGTAVATLKDDEAELFNAGKKAKVERTGKPVFALIVEMESPTCIRLYDSAASIDAILEGRRVVSERRWRAADGRILVQQESAYPQSGRKRKHAADEIIQLLRQMS